MYVYIYIYICIYVYIHIHIYAAGDACVRLSSVRVVRVDGLSRVTLRIPHKFVYCVVAV